MIRDGQGDVLRLKRATHDALMVWFRQSERLNIARIHYGLRGTRFTDFAARLGVDRASAFQLVKLWQHKAAILRRCTDEGRYYGWEHCLYWFERAPRAWNRTYPRTDGRRDERQTPPKVFAKYGRRCTLDVAATPGNALCSAYFTKEQDGLKQPWHGIVWLNPPYSNILPWCKKAVEYARAGGTVIALLPSWTDAHFFHAYCVLGRITFLKNRLVFRGCPGAHSPFASIIVEWSPATLRRQDAVRLDARVGRV
jgi:phage N-6-adenine-methyltransferase